MNKDEANKITAIIKDLGGYTINKIVDTGLDARQAIIVLGVTVTTLLESLANTIGVDSHELIKIFTEIMQENESDVQEIKNTMAQA